MNFWNLEPFDIWILLLKIIKNEKNPHQEKDTARNPYSVIKPPLFSLKNNYWYLHMNAMIIYFTLYRVYSINEQNIGRRDNGLESIDF